jgi:hypothetical protein
MTQRNTEKIPQRSTEEMQSPETANETKIRARDQIPTELRVSEVQARPNFTQRRLQFHGQRPTLNGQQRPRELNLCYYCHLIRSLKQFGADRF